MQYYPSGLPWLEAYSPSEQPYKYNGKEFVEMHGLDEYDSKARWYYPAICRTTTVDPLSDKYPELSPYVYCNWNPIKYVDPDGMDDFEVNWNPETSKVTIKQIENKDYDQFHVVDAGGSRVASSKQYTYRTITQLRNGQWGGGNLSLFNVKGDDNATELFEFLSLNFTEKNGSPLEWSRVIIGTSTSGRNIIGTSMKENATGVGHYIMYYGYTLRGVDHNHPHGTGPSHADIDNALIYHLKFPQAILRVFANGKYIPYDENTMRSMSGGELKEIEVIGIKR